MTALFINLHLFLARHRLLLALGLGLFAAGAVLLSRRLKLNEDYTDMLPMSDPAIAEQVEALKHIRQADRLFLDVQTTALDPELVAQAADRLYEAVRAIPNLGDIRYSFDATDAGDIYNQLQAQLPALLSSNDLREVESRLQPTNLENRLTWFKRSLSQPQGLMLAEAARTDPVGLSDVVSLRLRALQAGVGDARIVAGRITSPDGKHVLINVQPEFRSSDTKKSKVLLANVLRAARQVEGQFPPDAVRIAVTGAHRVALDNATLIQQDSTRTSILATVAVVVLMLATYRRRWLSLLGLAPTVFGGLGAIVAFAVTGQAVSAVALGCGSILIGVTVDYGIYILYHLDDSPPANRRSLARASAQLAPTLSFGALTTMAAFLVMFASPVAGHRQLGAFGAAGVALAALFAMVILPLFVPTAPGSAGAPAGEVPSFEGVRGRADAARTTPAEMPALPVLPLTGAMGHIFDWRRRHARAVLALVLGFSVLCVVGVWKLRFEGDLNRFNGVTPETRRDEELVREVWGKALSLTTIVVSGSTREAALQNNETVYALLRRLQADHAVESFSSIAPLLPSDKTQQANRLAWQAFWTEPRRLQLSNSLAQVSGGLGFKPEAFFPFLERLAAPLQPAAMEAGPESALDRLLDDYCSEKAGRTFICSLVKVKDLAAFSALRTAVLNQTPDARLLNKAALSEEITRIAKRGLPVFTTLVVALNALLLFLFLGRLELVLIALLPMAAGVFWTLGILGLFGLPIDMSNFIFVSFVLGVGGDYSLFLLMAELEPLRGHTARTASTGGAVTVCALTTLFGVGVLALARHPALFSIGLTALLGISLSLLATLLLVPWCMDRLRRRAALPALDGAQEGELASLPARRRRVRRLYHYHGPYVTQFVFWKMKTDPLFSALEQAVPPKGLILDLGCGYGIVAHWLTLAAAGRTVLGVDTDEEKIRVARTTATMNSRVSFACGEVLSWEYPACDCVLMADLLHYLPHDQKAEVLRKAYGALRPGGRLLVRDAFQESSRRHWLTAWSERLGVCLGQNRTAYGLRFESLETHKRMLAEIGFIAARTVAESGRGSNQLLAAEKPA